MNTKRTGVPSHKGDSAVAKWIIFNDIQNNKSSEKFRKLVKSLSYLRGEDADDITRIVANEDKMVQLTTEWK